MATIEGPSGAGGISEAFPIQQKKRTIERLVVLCVNIAPCECSEEVRFLRALLQKGGWSPKKDAAIMQSIVKLVKKSGVAAYGDLLEKLKKRSFEEAVATIEQCTPSLGRYGLIRGKPADPAINSVCEEWCLERALISEILHQTQGVTDEATRRCLEEAALRRCARAANPSEQETFVAQNPLARGVLYHREQYGTLLEGVETRLAQLLQMPKECLIALDSHRFAERLHQIPVRDRKVIEAGTIDELAELVVRGLQTVLEANPVDRLNSGRTNTVFSIGVDCSKLFAGVSTREELQQRSSQIRAALLERVQQWMEARPDRDQVLFVFRKLTNLLCEDTPAPEDLLRACCPVYCLIVSTFYGQPLLLDPGITRGGGVLDERFRNAVFAAGFNPTANNLYRSLLDLSGGYEALAQTEGLPSPSLDTGGYEIHGEIASLRELTARTTTADFQALSCEGAPPYQKVLAATTVDLLCGLLNERVDWCLVEKGLSPLLEASLFRIHNAMKEALLRKESMMDFLQQLDIIHEEIELLLSVANPYSDEEFAAVASRRLTEGADPVIPSGYGRPCISLKTSGMRALYSGIAGAFVQKKGRPLHAAILKDSYYEIQKLLDPERNAMCASCDVVDGDFFRNDCPLLAFQEIQRPVDLFVCEFHHNLCDTKHFYATEDLLGMILWMQNQGSFAPSCTVLIDTTIALEQSDEVRSLLKDETIHRLVQEGKLNIVLARSGQKFDMLGFDNYIAGVVTAVNNGESFRAFNERLLADDDQSTGIDRQGMTHLLRYGGDGLDRYRLALSSNTRKLYDSLPREMIHYEGSAYPIQFSDMEGESMPVFLDMKMFSSDVRQFVTMRLLRMVYEEALLVTQRSSFGFATTNMVLVNDSVRINPGLDSEKQLMRYAEFFRALHLAVDKAVKETGACSGHEVTNNLCRAIREMEVPGYAPPPRSCLVWPVEDLQKVKKSLRVVCPSSIGQLLWIAKELLDGRPPPGLIDLSALCSEPLDPDRLERVLRLLEYFLAQGVDSGGFDRRRILHWSLINLQVVVGAAFQGKQYLIVPEFFVRPHAADSEAVASVKAGRAAGASLRLEGLPVGGEEYDRDEIKELLQPRSV